jgi:RNA polymerase sigma factor (sigma-70 family)
MKKCWRYVYVTEWQLDSMSEGSNPEDDIISRLDGEEKEDTPDRDLSQMMSSLSPKEKEIVQGILFDGKTFAKVGAEVSLSKQRVHQIYKAALFKIKEDENGRTP